jgi:cellulose synthase (UDP-forming)
VKNHNLKIVLPHLFVGSFFAAWFWIQPFVENLWVELAYYLLATYTLSALFFFRNLVKGLALFGSLLFAARYFHWRLFYTLGTDHPVNVGLSGLIYLAEFYGWMSWLLFLFQTWRPTEWHTKEEPLDFFPTVDLFIPTYNEPVDILRRTIIGARAIDYPADQIKIYLLDDGKRPEMKALAESFGCEYIARPTNEHAKAGNLNYALARSRGERVVCFDADHVPVRSFLKETLPFFKDPKVAYVQTAHHFYNPDIFQKNLLLEREIINEQDLFFRVIQPGRDRHNAAFFAGSGAVFRRSALEEIGGFRTETLTEDLHTSILLHDRGYRSVYYNVPLSAGLSPESVEGHIKQRERWAKGSIQILLKDNPFRKSGLTFCQKICYFASVFYFFHGWARVIYLASPLFFLLFGWMPVNASLAEMVAHYLPYYLASIVAFSTIGGQFRYPFWSDVYETVTCFSLCKASLQSLLWRGSGAFSVTPKGIRSRRATFEVKHTFPHLCLGLLLVVGLLAAVVDFWTDPTTEPSYLNLVWAAYNLLLLGTTMVIARERPQRRATPRLPRNIPCKVFVPEMPSISAITLDLSETGLSFEIPQFILLPPLIRLDLTSSFGEITSVEGKIVRFQKSDRGTYWVGVDFVGLSPQQHQSLIRQMYSPSNSWEQRESETAPWQAVWALLTSWKAAFIRVRDFRREQTRYPLEIPCEVLVGSHVYEGRTLDMSETGVAVRLKESVDFLPEVVQVRFYEGTRIIGLCEAIRKWTKRQSGGTLLGIDFGHHEGRLILAEFFGKQIDWKTESIEGEKSPCPKKGEILQS